MKELTVPVRLDQLEQIHAFVDAELTHQGCPTILRLRTAMMTEELFSAAIDSLNGEVGTLNCVAGVKPGTFTFRFCSSSGVFSPDYTQLEGLLDRQCTYGLTIKHQEEVCTIAVGRSPSS